MMLVYQLKVGVLLLAFYLLFRLLLSRDTFHRLNRLTLLSMVALSLVLPWVQLSVERPSAVARSVVMVEGLLVSGVSGAAPESFSSASVAHWLFWLYYAGLLFFALREVWSLWQLHRMIGRAELADEREGVRIYVADGDEAPFSWFRCVVLSRNDYEQGPHAILTHELAHVRCRHSLDVLLMNVLTIFQWWNPAAWLLRRELQQVHEFEADEAVLREGVDARQYQLLLIRKAVGDRLFTMANNLSQRALRQRIRMMSAHRSAPVASLKLLLVVPVALLAVLAFAQPAVKKVAAQVESESRQALSEAIHEVAAVRKSEPSRQEPQPKRAEPKAPAAAGQQSYDVVEQMPEFPGGPKALMTYFATHVVYPQDAEEQGLQGRVVVTFIVNEDGSVSDAKVMRSISPSLDAEALRLVDEMPKWEPGVQSGKKVRVKFTVPITFRLMGEPTEPSASSASDAQDEASSLEVSSLASLPKTAYVIDGLRIPDDLSIDDLLQVADIASISVHKDAATLREYKAEGKTGIIYIHTKRVEK